METKRCSVCRVRFPCSSEFFVTDKSVKTGLGCICRKCSRIRTNLHHKLHPEVSRAYREKNKEAIKLKKHLDYLKNIESNREKRKAQYEQNKTQACLKAIRWKKENPDKMREISHDRYERTKEHHKELTRAWKQAHKNDRNIQWQARRSKILGLPYTLEPNEWERIKELFENRCCYCGKPAKLTQDHFVPVTLNGPYSSNNILPACQSCNSSKANKNFKEWYPVSGLYSAERELKILEHINQPK